MTTLTVRNVDDATARALRLAAAQLGISKEEFVRRSLRKIAAQSAAPESGLANRTGAALIARMGTRFVHGYAADLVTTGTGIILGALVCLSRFLLACPNLRDSPLRSGECFRSIFHQV